MWDPEKKRLSHAGYLHKFDLTQRCSRLSGEIVVNNPHSKSGWWFQTTPLKNDGVSYRQLG